MERFKQLSKKLLRAAEIFYWFAKRLDDAINSFPDSASGVDTGEGVKSDGNGRTV